MSCMLCQKTGRIFNVYANYGNANHTVRDDLIEIFGVDAEPYLCPSDFVCNVCMNMLDNVAKLKRRLWPLVCHANQDCKPIKLGKIWDIFASLKFEEDDDDEEHSVPCRTPTPSSLLAFSYSRAYNRSLEDKIANVERNRSLSRVSSVFGRSDASETSEVRNIFSRKKRKKKGHNWTRHKRHVRSPATSEFSHKTFPRRNRASGAFSDWNRSYSPLSDCSYISYYTIRKSPAKKKGVEYDDHSRLVRKRTRSVSRAQEEEARYLERLEGSKFYCHEKDCPLYFEDVDVLNHHRIMDHDMLALHFCDECRQKYTSSEHLKLHKKSHDVFPFLCPLCARDIKNQETLQQHLEEHMIYSVPCKYCDRSFLDKKSCENHHKSAHSGRRERIIIKDKIIIDRLDKDQESQSDNVSDSLGSRQYSVYVSPYTDMEFSKEDLDVTPENFELMNMDFIVDQGSCSSDELEVLTEPTSKENEPTDNATEIEV